MISYLGQHKTSHFLGETPSYYPGDSKVRSLINRIENTGRKATQDEVNWLTKAQKHHRVSVTDGNSISGRSPLGFALWLAQNEGITSKFKEVPDNSNVLRIEVQHYSSSERDRLTNKTSNFTVDDLLKIQKIEGPISFVEGNSVKSMPSDAIREYAKKRPQRFSTLQREKGSRRFYVAGDTHTAELLERRAEREETAQKNLEADENRILQEKKSQQNTEMINWMKDIDTKYYVIGGGVLLAVLVLGGRK